MTHDIPPDDDVVAIHEALRIIAKELDPSLRVQLLVAYGNPKNRRWGVSGVDPANRTLEFFGPTLDEAASLALQHMIDIKNGMTK